MTKLTMAAACIALAAILLAAHIVHSAAPQNAENEIRALIAARFAAMERKDFAAYERFIADSFVLTDEDGAVRGKNALLKDVRSDYAPGRNTTYEAPSEFHVQFYGSTAIASYRVPVHETFDAQVLSTDYRKCETYVKQDGAWKLVALSQQRIPNTTRVPAKIDTSVYDDYAGDYEVGPHFIVYFRRDGDRLMESASDDPTPVEDLPYSKDRFFQRGTSGQDVFLRDAGGKVTAVVWEGANGDIIARKIKSEGAPSAVTSHPASTGHEMGPPRSTASRAWGRGHEVAGKEDFVNSAALREEINQLRKTWNAAWLENDSATVDRLMAPEYVYVAPNGQVYDRSKIMGVILSPSYKLHHAEWSEVQINLLSDSAAVIIDRLQGTGTLNGNTFTDNNRCSRVCLRRNGSWQIVFEQASAIAP